MKNKNAVIKDIVKNPEEINIPATLMQYDIELEELPRSLLYDIEVATYYCQVDIDNLQNFTHFQDDENFINSLIDNDPFISSKAIQYASKRIQSLDYIVENACLHDGQALQYAHPKFYNDEKMVSIAFGTANRINNTDWKEVDKKLSLDKDFVFELICINRNLYKELDTTLQNNSEIVKKVLEKYSSYSMLPDNQKRKLTNMKLAASKSGLCIEHFPKDVLDNPQIMNNFLMKHPGAIQWCGDSLKSSISTASIVCNNNLTPHPYSFFDEKVRSNKEIALTSLKYKSECSEFLPDSLKNDEKFLKLLLSQNVDIKILENYPETIRGNDNLMKEICLQHPTAVQYVGNSLRYSNDFVQTMVGSITKNGLKDTTESYENYLNLKSIFKNFKFDVCDIEIFEIFIEGIKKIGFEKTLSTYMPKLFKELPEDNQQPSLCGENAVDNFNSMLLELKLSKNLTDKPNKIKVKI